MTIITTTPERRHLAKVLTFPAALAQHIAFDKIAQDATNLGANFDVRYTPEGVTVTLYWVLADEVTP